jgi:hypothetical protein
VPEDPSRRSPLSPATAKGWRTARLVALWVWLIASLVQLVVWVLVCAIGSQFVSPWWLWTVGLGGSVVAALWWSTQPRKQSSPISDRTIEKSQPW